MAPKSNTITGRYDESLEEVRAIVKATDPKSDTNRGRRVILALLESLDGQAKPADTVNASFNYSPGITGQVNITAVVTLTPAVPDAP